MASVWIVYRRVLVSDFAVVEDGGFGLIGKGDVL